MGTPKEDALRRDLTINSLFYNINTGLIEDFTMMVYKYNYYQGIPDLSNGVIRTPIDPIQTFLDDPLRILRVIRFSVRFQFYMEPEIEKSVKSSKDIKLALYNKVTNERIHKEIELMFEGNKPHCAIYLLYKLEILDNILKIPLDNEFKGIDKLNVDLMNPDIVQKELINVVNISSIAGIVFEYLFNSQQFLNFLFFEKQIEESFIPKFKKSVFFDLIAFPFRKYLIKIKKDFKSGSEIIISKSLKLPNESIKEIELITRNYDAFKKIINSQSFDRLSVGINVFIFRFINQKYNTQIFKPNVFNCHM